MTVYLDGPLSRNRDLRMKTIYLRNYIKMCISAQNVVDIMIQHGCSMNCVPDRDRILIQKGHCLCDVFMGYGEDWFSNIIKKFAGSMSKFFFPNGIISVKDFLKYFCIGTYLNFRGAYLFKDSQARGFQWMRAAKDIHDNITVEEVNAHLLLPDLSLEYSFSHLCQSSGGGTFVSPESFNKESTASFIRLIFSSLIYVSSMVSRIRVPIFLCFFAANSSRVWYCFSVKSTWTRCVYFMRKYYQSDSIMSIVFFKVSPPLQGEGRGGDGVIFG